MRTLCSFLNLNLVLALASLSAATTWAYAVKTGDTLSSIAYANISKKVYGKNGSLKKIITLNPQIKNPDIIHAGESVSLSKSAAHKLSQIDTESESESESIEHKSLMSNVKSTEQKVSNEKSSFIEISPYFSILKLESKDNSTNSNSTLASKYCAGFTASTIQAWTPKLQSFIQLKIGKVDFEKPTNSNRTLSDVDKLITSLGFGTHHYLSDKLMLGLSADYGTELFIRAATTQNDTVDAIHIPSLGTQLTYDFANMNLITLGASSTYKLKLPAHSGGYDVLSGSEWGASLYIKKFLKKTDSSRLETEIGFFQRTQNTSVASQQETKLILTLSYFFSDTKPQRGLP